MVTEAARPCPIIDQLGNVGEIFLDESQPFNLASAQSQRVLGAIWKIAEFYSPAGVGHFEIPTIRLYELGLIDEDVVHRLRKRISQILGSDEPRSTNRLESARILNPADSKKPVDGFTIKEDYVDTAGDYPMNYEGGRHDHIVHRRILLTNTTGTEEQAHYLLVVGERKADEEFHGLGKTWIPKYPYAHPSTFEQVEATARHLNATLALFIEGTQPNYLTRIH